jgi:hypothetical protein
MPTRGDLPHRFRPDDVRRAQTVTLERLFPRDDRVASMTRGLGC